jgi:hypothetical protein
MTMAEKYSGCGVFVRLELRKRRSLNKKKTRSAGSLQRETSLDHLRLRPAAW